MNNKDKIIELLESGATTKEICDELDCYPSSVLYQARKLGIRNSNSSKFDWAEISEYYKTHTRKDTMEKFKIYPNSWDLAVARGDVISRGYEAAVKDRELPLDELLMEHSPYNTIVVKRRILKEGLLENVCSECGQKPYHNGKPLVLQLDHINGVNNDHRLENLRLLCPNCHTQTPTWGSRNKIR